VHVHNSVVTWTIPRLTLPVSALRCVSRFVNLLQQITDVIRLQPTGIFSQQRHSQSERVEPESVADSEQSRPFRDSNPTPIACDRLLTAKY
jgi:hypothetical protein